MKQGEAPVIDMATRRCLASTMRTVITIAIFCATAPVHAATPWEQYLDRPAPENAALVTKVEYTHVDGRTRDLSEEDLQILQNQVLGLDPEAFGLAIRLYQSSDGGNAEDLGVLLGRTVRAQPAFFLRQITRLRISCASIAWALRSPGPEYVDRPRAREFEIAKRQEALRAVRTPGLAKVRQQCLAVFTAP